MAPDSVYALKEYRENATNSKTPSQLLLGAPHWR